MNRQGGQLDRSLDLMIISRDGSANAPGDYSKLMLTKLFFESDRNRLCINVTIVDDFSLEDDETFSLLLTSTDNAVVLGVNITSVTIIDDDIVTLELQPSHLIVSESTQQVYVTVELTGSREREVSLMLETTDGSAYSLTGDYMSFSEKLVFPPSSANGSTLSVNIIIIDDLLVEEVEYFTIHASSMDAAINYTGRNSTTFHIEDDDCMFVLNF